jgi:hypothetical protein
VTDLAGQASTTITDECAEAWITKAQALVDPLLPGKPATRVRTRGCPDPLDAPYGNFMMGWPESDGDGFVLGHLVECGFFLALLQRCYAPVLDKKPELTTALTDGSRLEVAITNDVLQVRAPGPPGAYSMIRHHALMLLAATWWLPEPAKARWLTLYDDIATAMMEAEAVPPSATEIVDTEAAAFEDFTALARASITPGELGDGDPRLHNILRYQTFAATAIAVAARACRDVPEHTRDEWLREQLDTGYREPDYLLEDWRRLL